MHKKNIEFCELCAHFLVDTWYYKYRKNPPIHYIVFATPHKKKYLLQKSQLIPLLFYCLKISLLFTLFSAMKYLLRRNPAVRNTVTE